MAFRGLGGVWGGGMGRGEDSDHLALGPGFRVWGCLGFRV